MEGKQEMEAAFNDQRTLEALSKMEFHQQLALGVACCERMLPNYETFMREANWGNVRPLRRALDTIWEICNRTPIVEVDLQEVLSQCEECTPESEVFTSLHVASAQDAVFAVCALLDFLLDGDINRIVSVLRLSTDSVDLIVQEQEEMDPRDPLLEQKILEHPLMQQELIRQRRDFFKAIRIASGDADALLALREQAQGESSLTLEL